MPDLESTARFYVSDLSFLRTPPVNTGPMLRASSKYDLEFGPSLNMRERPSKPRRSALLDGACKNSSRQFVTVLAVIAPIETRGHRIAQRATRAASHGQREIGTTYALIIDRA